METKLRKMNAGHATMLMVSKSGRRNAISHYRTDTRILAGFFTNCDASSTQRRKQCLPALLVHSYICVMLQRLRIHVNFPLPVVCRVKKMMMMTQMKMSMVLRVMMNRQRWTQRAGKRVWYPLQFTMRNFLFLEPLSPLILVKKMKIGLLVVLRKI